MHLVHAPHQQKFCCAKSSKRQDCVHVAVQQSSACLGEDQATQTAAVGVFPWIAGLGVIWAQRRWCAGLQGRKAAQLLALRQRRSPHSLPWRWGLWPAQQVSFCVFLGDFAWLPFFR